MLVTVLLLTAIPAAIAAAITIRQVAQDKLASAGRFDEASSRFHSSAMALLRGDDPVPPEVITLLARSSAMLASVPVMRSFARSLAGSQSPQASGTDWPEVISKMSQAQRAHFMEAIASLNDAAINVSLLYRHGIIKNIYTAGRNKSQVRFGTIEAKISAPLIQRAKVPDHRCSEAA